MAYPALEQCVRLLEAHDSPAQELHLSRRVRHLPVAFDRDGDVGAAMFLRRGVSGEPVIDVHALRQHQGGWLLLGGGSGSGGDSLLDERPRSAHAATLAIRLGSGGILLNADRLMPWGAKWMRWAQLRLAVEVTSLQVGERRVPVLPHGAALVVWRSRRPPPIAALDCQGAELGSILLREQ